MANSHYHGAPDEFGERGSDVVGNPGTPVLSHKERRLAATQGDDQLLQVERQGCPVIVSDGRDLRWWIAAQKWCDHAISVCGKRWYLVAPRPSVVRKTVNQKHCG